MEMGELVAEINTTFQDPIVEMRLKAYGVDPWVDYEEVQNRSLPKLSGEISVGDTPIDEVFWGLFYAGSVLDYNLAIQDKIDAQPNLVRGSLDSISTDIKRHGEKILDWAASIGFDTPDKMERMLQHILSYYDLEPILYLRKFA